MKQNVTQIAIVGCGRVGGLVASLLLSRVPEPLLINVIDPSPNAAGTLMELQHSLPLYPQHQLLVHEPDHLKQADYVFLCAGVCSSIDASRLSVLEENRCLMKRIFEGVDFQKEPYIFVVTNPVELMAYWVWKYSGLPSTRVFGTGTLLDSVRLQSLLAQEFSVPVGEVDAWVLGEHGANMVPTFSQAKIAGEKIVDKEIFATRRSFWVDWTRKAARRVKRTQGATFYAVAQCVVQVFEAIFRNGNACFPLSTQVPSSLAWLEKETSSFLSLPVVFSSDQAPRVELGSLSDVEKQGLIDAAHVLGALLQPGSQFEEKEGLLNGSKTSISSGGL